MEQNKRLFKDVCNQNCVLKAQPWTKKKPWLLSTRGRTLGAIVRRGLPEPEMVGGGGFLRRALSNVRRHSLLPESSGPAT